MAKQPQQPLVTDPNSVPETFCDGQFNLSITGGTIATLTFTHVRPDPKPLFQDGTVRPTAVVRARIVTTIPNLIALRDLLNRMIQTEGAPTTATAGPTRH